MASLQRRWFKALTRVAAVMLVGAAVSACSTVPSWVDPTSWMGPDVPDQAQASNDTYPDLSKIPSAPQQTASNDSAAVANSLAQARNDVQYSAQALRGGTEAAAAPPAPAPTKAQIAQAEAQASKAAPEKQEAAAKPEAEDAAPEANEPAPAAAREPDVATAQEPAAAPASAEPAVPAIRAMTTAQSSVPGAMPAIPVAGPDGFEPSKAPPLDASVAQYVPAPIIARYAQTGSVAPVATAGGNVSLRAPNGARQAILGTRQSDVGGPETMSGAVVADLGTLQGSAAQPSVYTDMSGLRPAAVVHFPGDSAGLTAAGRSAIKMVAEAYRDRGGQGYVRVVGHASSRAGKMSLVRRMEINFRNSQNRARAVARELIREGVPANKVLIDAVGDSPSADGGGDGNRRAEIFLQG